MRNSVTLSIYYGADTTCLHFQNSVNTLITMQKKKNIGQPIFRIRGLHYACMQSWNTK